MAAIEIVITREQTDDDWMMQAACKGLTHLFFPAPAERPQARERREATARQVCAGCVVHGTCRDFARDQHEYGFWGGESEEERAKAGYPVALPTGRVARIMMLQRNAASHHCPGVPSTKLATR